MECLSCSHSCPHNPMCHSPVLWLVSECFHAYHRNLLLLEVDACLSTCFTFLFSFHTTAVKLPLTLVLMSPHFIFRVFLKSFKCDLNLAVSIFTVWKVSGAHGHPFQFAFQMNTPLWLWRNVLIYWVIFPSLLHVTSGWCSVSANVKSNLGLQDTKPTFF